MIVDLLRAEIFRLRYRRRATWSVLLMLIIGLVLPGVWMPSAMPLTAREKADAAAAFQLNQQTAGSCTTSSPCHLSDFQRSVMSWQGVLDSASGFAMLIALVVLAIVITYIASDFTSGALATQLTFTPSRPKVLMARTIGGALLGAVLLFVSTASSVLVSAVWFLSGRGLDAIGYGQGTLSLLWSSALYGALLGAAVTLVVFIFGGAVFAGGVTLAALIVNLALPSVAAGRAAEWMYRATPIGQGAAVLRGSDAILTGGDILSTRGEGIGYHLVVIAVLAAVALVVFNRRDIRN